MARLSFIFGVLTLFSFFGLLAMSIGYDFYHIKNPNGVLTIFFLIFSGVTLFLGFQLLKAFTDPLPAWLDYWMTPAHRAPITDRQKKTVIMAFAIPYVVMMTGSIIGIIGSKQGLTLERIAFPLGIGLLAVLLLFFLFDVSRAIYTFWNSRKTSSSTDKPRS